MNKIYILDACALIAFFKKETGWETVFNILGASISGGAVVFMHEINLLEVYYGLHREKGKEYADVKISEASSFFTTISGLTPAAFSEAGRLKSSYKISLADSIALSQASVIGATLITADHHEFDPIEPVEQIKFLWLR
ncbi:MAG: PIN domain-containing protein [Defluviitaleaceae bacterium]|nr:PIN domain-containing protein [Defluviitaleaceae bacterium]MCL2262260.1 PIN domain-containing protein [Defluviitaleaceae bacterium]